MKIMIFLTLLFFSGAVSMEAQQLEKIQIETNEILNCSADNAWLTVTDWNKLHELVPNIVESTVVEGAGLNATWQINLISGASLVEKMVYYNSDEKTMSYIMTETPMPIEDYTAIIKVESYGISKSLISFYTECKTSIVDKNKMSTTFKDFQEVYIAGVKNKCNE